MPLPAGGAFAGMCNAITIGMAVLATACRAAWAERSGPAGGVRPRLAWHSLCPVSSPKKE